MIHKKGFSLIEVLVFTGIVSIFFIVVASVATVSLRTARINQNKILATHAGEELMEWLKGEREADWNSFSQRSGTFCLNGNLKNTWAETMLAEKNTSGQCSGLNEFLGVGTIPPLIFKREVTLNPLSSTQTDIAIRVTWMEIGVSYVIPIQSRFTLWE